MIPQIAYDIEFEFEPDVAPIRVRAHRSADGTKELTGFTRRDRMLAADFQHHFTEADERRMREIAAKKFEAMDREIEAGNGD